MSDEKACGPHARKSFTYRELPIGATSIGVHDDVIKTGIWRVHRPIFKIKTPPCNEACPAGVDVRAFITLMLQERFREAHRLYLDENPFPAVCGRVCFHPCEDVCNRKDFDKAVAINALERFLAESDAPIRQNRSMGERRVAVVGSGPAGMSCSYFLSRLGHRVTVFEALGVVGGLLRTGIPDYRLPVEVVEKEVEKLKALGIQFKTHYRIQEKNWQDLDEFDAIVLAYGAGERLPLFASSPGEKQKMLSGSDFLKTVKLGGAVSLGHKVAVIGGGNTAIDAARVALRLGARPTIIYRRSRAEMPAFSSEVEDALGEGVEILYLTSPVALEKRDSGLRIKCVKNRLGEPDESARPRPVPIKGSGFSLMANTVIAAIGETPDLSFLPRGIKLAERSVQVDELGATSKRGIFACGDLVAQPRSVAHAIGSGKRAAIAIDFYLGGRPAKGLTGAGSVSFQQYVEGGPWVEYREVIGFDALNPGYFSHQERSETPRIPDESARTSFAEVYGGLSLEQAQGEARRCFSCGMCDQCDNCYLFCPDSSVLKQRGELLSVIDYDYCKGCGICANECPVGSIEMEEEDQRE